MPMIAYLANQFPAAVEPYVGDELQELRQRGVAVIPVSVRRRDTVLPGLGQGPEQEILCLQPLRAATVLRALWLAMRRWRRIHDLVGRVLLGGKESFTRRLKAVLHTLLGAYYAVLLKDRGVDHIHAHHGYFGSWIAMMAARFLDVGFSLTVHGSDLLLGSAYLGTKLKHCAFCITISEYNRRYLLEHFPEIAAKKIIVSRLGVEVPPGANTSRGIGKPPPLRLLSVGRLHPVKDHAFLVRACIRLRRRGMLFRCSIAGEGPERRRLEAIIGENGLQQSLTLLGHVSREEIELLFASADVIVLTSRSEGIPLVLMEAMARGKIVLAPAITGIPELVIPGKTGFLYAPEVLDDFVSKVLSLEELMNAETRSAVSKLDWVRHAARMQILHNFNGKQNLARFGDRFLRLIETDHSTKGGLAPLLECRRRSPSHEDLVLQ
jgi:colanic acid/amylovoran biosynthesis glycosyltransferase